MPRKKSEQFYKEHGFLPRCINGKYSAICKGCDKELFNTALSRLLMHKQNCDKKNFDVRTVPKSGSLAALKADKVRAQIRQFQSKTQFLKTETDNLKLERTLALLKIQKLRLEIDSLRAYS
ncbi:uncharacterized protein Dwil_GK22432 [Drosophila willistoni]|uniref:Uncharacterized protein n=1 Tax=Drosophila willistoni TaxID=7260 RepID=B4NG15_DROWI|nr:uncharacterized protein Dwil_GK22432 [Drosophila willistoni]